MEVIVQVLQTRPELLHSMQTLPGALALATKACVETGARSIRMEVVGLPMYCAQSKGPKGNEPQFCFLFHDGQAGSERIPEKTPVIRIFLRRKEGGKPSWLSCCGSDGQTRTPIWNQKEEGFTFLPVEFSRSITMSLT